MTSEANPLIVQLKAAYTLQKQGDNEAALRAYDDLLKTLPDFPDLLFFKATALDALGRTEESLVWMKQALKQRPLDVNFNYHYSRMLQSLGRLAEAEQALEAILSKVKGSVLLHNALAGLLEKQGAFDKAIHHYHAASGLDPSNLVARAGYGWALHRLGKTTFAIPFLESAVAGDPSQANWHNNLGVLYKETREYAKAEQSLLQAISLDAKQYAAYINLCIIYTDQKRFDAAHRIIDAAIAEGENGAGRYYKSLLFFLEGNIPAALGLWEWRWKHANAPPAEWPFPKWEGGDLGGKKLLIWGEQGIGDELMFASMIPALLEKHPDSILVCQRRLVPIYARSFPCEVQPRNTIPVEQLSKRTDIGAQCPIGDLMHYVSPVKSYPIRSGYLKPDAQAVEQFRHRCATLSPPLKVGISWYSSNYSSGNVRSISLSDWLPVLKVPGVQFISVQYGDFRSEVRAFAKQHSLALEWDDAVNATQDMDALMNQIGALDMVISVANSTVHAAGSQGVPVWVMLPEVPSWRWQMNRDDSLWYSHIRLFRQRNLFVWHEVIDRIAAALHEEVGNRK